MATEGQTARGVRYTRYSRATYKKNTMSAQMLEVSLLGLKAELRLERDAW